MADDNHSGKPSTTGQESLKRELLGIGGTEPAKGGKFKPGQSGNPKGRPKRTPYMFPTKSRPRPAPATLIRTSS
jgi:hypothetical protein